jgi:hypothetical protein
MNEKRPIPRLIEVIIRGTIPVVPHITEAARPGRPKDEARHVALLAHFYMFRREISGIKGVQAIRRTAADAISVGNRKSPENQERQAREQIAKGENVLIGNGQIITFSGDESGEGRCWLAVEDVHEGVCSQVDKDGTGYIVVDGWGWLCEFGEQRARYGHIQSQVAGSEGGEKFTKLFLSLPTKKQR